MFYLIIIEHIRRSVKTTPFQPDAQANAIGGTVTGNSYSAISTVRNNILAVKNGALSILSPQLSEIRVISGMYMPYGVEGVEAFPIDLDNDGNIGSYEDEDGDPMTSAQESFDLALVLTPDGIEIINVTNPQSPEKMDMIPVSAGKILVDREKRVAYVLNGGGLSVISLKDLRALSDSADYGVKRDKDKDGTDDRVLLTLPEASGMDMVLSDDGSLAYIADYSGGKVKMVKIGKICEKYDYEMELSEIKGLYNPNLNGVGEYVEGYTSDDNEGRIYTNRIYNSDDITKTIWTKDKQYIDLTVEIQLNDSELSDDARIVWRYEDPDDLSDNDMNAETAEVIDPNGNAGDDNIGHLDSANIWEEVHADYQLSNGNETRIKNGVSKVRFNVTDSGGDNFIVKARIKFDANQTTCPGDETGIMTIWKKVNVEYVRMKGSGGGLSADPIPTDEINNHYKKAFVEFDILQERLVDPKFVKYKTDLIRDYWAIGLQDDEPDLPDYAPDNLKTYATKTEGEFSREDKGWYFMAAAHDWIPLSGIKSLVLYPRPDEQNDDNNQLSDWAFSDDAEKGVNTDLNYKLYIKVDKPSDVRIRVYKDATFSDLVAEGTGDDGPIALNEMNESGLYGYVKVSYTADDDDIVLSLSEQGNAVIAGAADSDDRYQITLADSMPARSGIDNLYELKESIIYLYNEDASKRIGFMLNSGNTSIDRKTIYIYPHVYSQVDDPNRVYLKDLTDHNWLKGNVVKVKIYSSGAYGVAGTNDYVEDSNKIFFNGRLMFFSGFTNTLEIVLHELGHALGFAHRCGNKDYKNEDTCFMEYGVDWLLTMPYDPNPSNRDLIPWSNDDVGLDLCPYHIDMIRKTKLEQDSNGRRLGW